MLSLKSSQQIHLQQSDCLTALKKIKSESIDLIYLDPPFFSQRKHELMTRDGSKKYSFTDTWVNRADYLNFLKIRLIECRRTLKKTGSLFFHCDSSAGHYIKVMLDEVFGEEQFRLDIIWSYKRWSNSKKGLLSQHQNILFYSKTEHFKFNFIHTDYSPTTNVEQIVQKRRRDTRLKSVYSKSKDGRAILAESKKGVPLGDVWDIPFLNPKAKERVQYPTQKPLLLIERILQIATDEGDTILDPFCGSGTTLVAAQLLKRHAIGFDQSAEAVKLAKSRLDNPVKTNSKLLENGKQAYLKQNPDLTEMVKEIGAVPVLRNKGIDGLLNLPGRILPFKIIFNEDELQDAHKKILKAVKKNQYSYCGLYCQFSLLKKIKNNFFQKNNVFLFENKDDLLKQIKISSQYDL